MSHEAATSEVRASVFHRMLRACVLPKTVSAFEQSYLARMNKIALAFFYAHLPIFLLISWVNDTDPLFTLFLTAAVLLVPFLGCRAFTSQRAKSLVFGFTSMCMGGILVHIGQGPVQEQAASHSVHVHSYLARLLVPRVMRRKPSPSVVGIVGFPRLGAASSTIF